MLSHQTGIGLVRAMAAPLGGFSLLLTVFNIIVCVGTRVLGLPANLVLEWCLTLDLNGRTTWRSQGKGSPAS